MRFSKERIEYIDCLKGFCMVWVLWFHTYHPSFVGPGFPISIFFFLSGVFFKKYATKDFIVSRINRLLIPYLFFFVISVFFQRVIFIWYNWNELRMLSLTDLVAIFSLAYPLPYTYTNIALWFLPALIKAQVFLFFLLRLFRSKWLILLVSVSLFFLQQRGFNNSFLSIAVHQLGAFNQIYFTFGFVFGRFLIEKTNDKMFQIIGGPISFFFIVFGLVVHKTFDATLCIVAFLVFAFIVFRFFSKYRLFYLLYFFGINSLIVLGLHYPIIMGCELLLSHQGIKSLATLFVGISVVIITLSFMFFIIKISKKYIPHLVGEKESDWLNGLISLISTNRINI